MFNNGQPAKPEQGYPSSVHCSRRVEALCVNSLRMPTPAPSSSFATLSIIHRTLLRAVHLRAVLAPYRVVRAGIRKVNSVRDSTPELGAEFGSCCRSAGTILIGILQNRLEVQFSAKDRLPQGSCSAEVERWGHPPNFVRPSIEGEQKFGGWICERWVPSSVVAGGRQGRSLQPLQTAPSASGQETRRVLDHFLAIWQRRTHAA